MEEIELPEPSTTSKWFNFNFKLFSVGITFIAPAISAGVKI